MKGIVAAIVAVAAILALTAGIALADTRDYEEAGATSAIGGLLITSDGRLEYRAPADGYPLSGETRIRYFKSGLGNLPSRPDGTVWVGEPFKLELRSWPELEMFSWSKPAGIIIHYKPEELGGRSESSLRIMRYFDRWVLLPAEIDTVNHTVTARAPWGGVYGLVAYDGEAPPMPAAVEGSGPGQARAATPQAPHTASTITGRIFYDKNGNGVFDGDDAPVEWAGVRISNGSWIGLASTGADGYYNFSNLGAGSYTLKLVVGAEWESTKPNPVSPVTVTGQADSTGTVDFGLTYRSWYKPW